MRARVALLASPVFVGAVVLLAANDQLLKEHHPGWLTGKLSDFAGLLVVVVLLTVVTGNRSVSVVLGAVGFVMLKTVPAVASTAPWFLGGPSRLDTSDLLALAVLAPAYWWLGRHTGDQPGDAQRVLGAIGGCVVLLALTATSCAAPEQVVHLVQGPNGSLLAGTGIYGKPTDWAVSRDGRTWTQTRRSTETPPTAAQAVCRDDGTCYRVIPGARVESQAPGGPWHTEFRYTEEQERRRDQRIMSCVGAVPTFDSVALAGTGDRQHVVVGMGPDGVLWRRVEGHWERRAVLGVEPTRIDGDSRLADLGLGTTLAVPVLLLMAALLVRLFTGRWNRWLWVAVGGSVVILWPVAAFADMAFDYTVSGPLLVVVAIAVLIGSGLLARFGPAPRRIAGWYQDPEDEDQLRWWDSRRWTEHRYPKTPTG